MNSLDTYDRTVTVTDNVVRGCTIGLYVVYGAFGQVKKNVIEDCTGSGMRTGNVSHQLMIKDNVVRRCGNATSAGYHIDGITQVLKNNRAEDCAGNGFLLLSTDFDLENCEALRCGRDGFNIETSADRARLKNCVAKDNRGEPLVEALYTDDDVVRALEHFHSVPYRRPIEIAPGVRLRFLDAGHVLGSAITELTVQEGGAERRIVFTGDLGRYGRPGIQSGAQRVAGESKQRHTVCAARSLQLFPQPH